MALNQLTPITIIYPVMARMTKNSSGVSVRYILRGATFLKEHAPPGTQNASSIEAGIDNDGKLTVSGIARLATATITAGPHKGMTVGQAYPSGQRVESISGQQLRSDLHQSESTVWLRYVADGVVLAQEAESAGTPEAQLLRDAVDSSGAFTAAGEARAKLQRISIAGGPINQTIGDYFA